MPPTDFASQRLGGQGDGSVFHRFGGVGDRPRPICGPRPVPPHHQICGKQTRPHTCRAAAGCVDHRFAAAEQFAAGQLSGGGAFGSVGPQPHRYERGTASGVHVDDRSPVLAARRDARSNRGPSTKPTRGCARARRLLVSRVSRTPGREGPRRRVRCLDARGRPVSTSPVAPTPSTWHGTPDPSKLATWQQVLDRLNQPGTAIVDTRSLTSTRAKSPAPSGAGRFRAPSHLEWTNNLSPGGRFKSPAELGAMYHLLGVTPDREVVNLLPGWVSRCPHVFGAPDTRVPSPPELHGVLERMGRIARICRSRAADKMI